MSECSWWWLGLAFVAGLGVGQVVLMAALVIATGGGAHRDEHEEGV